MVWIWGGGGGFLLSFVVMWLGSARSWDSKMVFVGSILFFSLSLSLFYPPSSSCVLLRGTVGGEGLLFSVGGTSAASYTEACFCSLQPRPARRFSPPQIFYGPLRGG